MNILNLIQALRQGATLRNAGTWANATAATSALTALAWALVQLAGGFGYAMPINQDQLATLAGAVVAIVGVVAPVLHIVANPLAGLPTQGGPGDTGLPAPSDASADASARPGQP